MKHRKTSQKSTTNTLAKANKLIADIDKREAVLLKKICDLQHSHLSAGIIKKRTTRYNLEKRKLDMILPVARKLKSFIEYDQRVMASVARREHLMGRA